MEIRHFLSKCHENSMTWTRIKSMPCSSMEKIYNLDKWHGIVMEFGVNLDQTATKSSCDEKWHGISIKMHVTFFTGGEMKNYHKNRQMKKKRITSQVATRRFGDINLTITWAPYKKFDRDFLMPFWRHHGRKTHPFLSKCHENSMTWTCQKSRSCFSIESK